MKLLTISNLYPFPDQPTRGMYNEQLFREMHGVLAAQDPEAGLDNLCLVPEWRSWRRAEIRTWASPAQANHDTTYVPVSYVPLVGRNWTASFYRRELSAFQSRFESADVVYASWLHPDGTAAAAAARASGKPCWQMVLGTDTFHLQNPGRKREIIRAAEDSQGYICVCTPLADRLVEAGIPGDKVHVVPNGVDSTRFFYREKIPARDELLAAARNAGNDPVVSLLSGLNEEDRIILFVGNLVAVKAPDVLLRAFSQIPQGEAGSGKLHLAMIGTGHLESKLRQLARELAVNDQTHFIGSAAHETVPLWMTASDCLVLPSRSEGMPNVVLEALASGLPIVCTDVGASAEMISGVPGARLVLPDDVPATAQAIVELLNANTDRRAMADHHGNYTWRDQAERILGLVQS